MTRRRHKTRSRRKGPSSSGRHGWALFRLWALYILGFLLVAFVLWVLYLNGVVREKFEGKKWSVPARVYARPLELYQGLSVTHTLFEQELLALGYRPVERISGPGQYARRIDGGAHHYEVYSRGFEFWDKDEPARRFQMTLEDGRLTRMSEADGDPLPLMRLEPEEIGGIFPAHGEDRLLVRLEDVPPLLGETLLAVEDRHFVDHFGISPSGILRAAWANIQAGRVVQGGSTLTQQLVKNFYLTHERSFQRKIQEAVMAVLLEVHYSKAQILETYINEVYLGQSGSQGVHGFALGAQHYFAQPLGELSTEKIALLIGIVKGASYYNPWRHPERVKNRRDLVLRVMEREGLIDAAERERATNAPLGIVPDTDYSLQSYPAFIDLVKRQLRRDYREEDLKSEGLRIFTSLSPMVQRRLERVVSERIHRLEQGYDVQGLQGSAVVTSVGAGEVLALVGDRNARFDGFNRALDARRPIGSLVKPFVYLTALQRPDEYHPGTLISDEPVVVEARNGQRWEPRNSDLKSHGEVPLYQGLIHSYNQATARLGMTLGLESVYDTLREAGFEGDIPQVPAILLGAVEMSPYEVSGIYHTLAAEGVYTPLRAIREVLTAEGDPLRRYPLKMEQRFSPEASFQMQYLLQLALREGTGKQVYDRLPEGLALAGKTGTTNDYRDSWFAGFSGQHLAVFWMGRDNNDETPLTGSTGALHAWADLMGELPTQGLPVTPPGNVSFDWLDEETGKLSAERCEGAVWLPLREGQGPEESADCRLDRSSSPSWWQRLWR
ncbi:penicillin-binding protein 1B [Marinimicrobium agarilyticum]|uniref:penicillin-binding protein 1B n=1 Tax=Marinimicrobium agarilyticum TaxID=306546 RepID=UPI000426FCD3|nr:penicillin-binding protein 1B [Marinimicrobium agarilyticum]